MTIFNVSLVEPYIEKDSLTKDDIFSLKKIMYLKGDFTPVEDFYMESGILDSLTVNLLSARATIEQVKMMLNGSIPIVPDQRIILVFLVLKSYRKLIKDLFSFIKSGDKFFKQKLAEDILFEDEYLLYIVKLLKSDVEFISALISTHKYQNEHIEVLVHSEEPEVLFRVASLTSVLVNELRFVKLLLNNPFTPDESIVQLKQLIFDLQQEEEGKEEVLAKEAQAKELEEIERLDQIKSEEDRLKTKETAIDLLSKDEAEIDKEVEGNLFAKVLSMNMPDKMKLAMKGNKSARMLLIKDPNKQIALAALGNPRITDSEISFILKNKSTGEHLIREIARDRTWMKEYYIIRDLTSHPKTPIEVSSKLIGRLYLNDLGRLAKSKDIPVNVRTMAARMFEIKNKKK